MYRGVWKCRLCGGKFDGANDFTTNEIVEMLNRVSRMANTLVAFHECYGGDVGIADFQGFKKLERVEKDG